MAIFDEIFWKAVLFGTIILIEFRIINWKKDNFDLLMCNFWSVDAMLFDKVTEITFLYFPLWKLREFCEKAHFFTMLPQIYVLMQWTLYILLNTGYQKIGRVFASSNWEVNRPYFKRSMHLSNQKMRTAKREVSKNQQLLLPKRKL